MNASRELFTIQVKHLFLKLTIGILITLGLARDSKIIFQENLLSFTRQVAIQTKKGWTCGGSEICMCKGNDAKIK
jgi:hypothetical protein